MIDNNDKDNTSVARPEPKNTDSYSNSIYSEMSIESKPLPFEKQNNCQFLVRSVFSLSKEDAIIEEFSCYLVQLVTLPGWMYISETSICFFAPLPGKENAPYKTGYISKKNHRTSPRSFRYHFVLRNHVLSWYDSAENHYEPLGSIELKNVTDIHASKTRKNGFKIITPTHKYLFAADSQLSLKEWMDDLRRAMFIAKNHGNSVRIVLPFTKITAIQKSSAANFVEFIKMDISDEDNSNETNDSYYFSFFPDLDKAYDMIHFYWKIYHHEEDKDSKSSFVKLDSDEANQTDVADSYGMVTQLTKNLEASTMDDNSLTIDTTLTTEPTPSTKHKQSNTGSPLNKALKRLSNSSQIFSNAIHATKSTKTTTSTSTSTSTTTTTPTATVSSTSSLASSSKNYIQSNTNSTVKNKRIRSTSFRTIKHFATLPLHLPSKDYIQDLMGHHDNENSNKMKKNHMNIPKLQLQSSSSKDNMFNNNHNNNNKKLLSTDYFLHKKEATLSSISFWMSIDLKLSLDVDVSSLTNTQSDLETSYQKLLNEELFKYFPMLDTSESVIAFYRSSVWRLFPYYGKLYVTQNHICFHSNVLAGQQKIIIPFDEIINIRRLKSRGYYLLHGLGVVAKDTIDEIFLEFSSVEYRDSCYALLCFKSKKSWEEQHYSSGSDSDDDDINNDSNDDDDDDDDLNTSTITSNMKEAVTFDHIVPPNEYKKDGPPLLSPIPTINRRLNYTKPNKPLTITCLTIGSRGDVQPYIALCKELQKDGHHCRIASHGEYQSWVEKYSIEFKSIGGDPSQLMKLCIDNGFLSYYFIKNGYKFFYSWFETLLEASWEACKNSDILIESPSAMVGIHLAEKLEIPYFRSMPFPWTRTTKFPHPFAMPNYGAGRVYNDMTYVMIEMALWTGTSKLINRFRCEKLGLAATTLDKLELWKVPHLYSFSPLVVHPPKDWAEYVHCTGYWFLDEKKLSAKDQWQPTQELLDFLNLEKEGDDHRPIVYIGFGSIIVPDPEAMTKVIVEAVLQADVRAIVCKGWSSRIVSTDLTNQGNTQKEKESTTILQSYPDTIFKLDSVPHSWLFPKINAVVHHGGAGTTAAGLQAGLPTIIKPFFGDQRFWGQRVEELGVGICIPKLTTDKLKESLVTITTNSVIINKAKLLGESIRQENGTKKAVECIYRDMELAKRIQLSESSDILDNESSSNRLSIYSYATKLKHMSLFGSDDNNNTTTITSSK
ncbi:unnamed protein product [Cunninghamella echinulata]